MESQPVLHKETTENGTSLYCKMRRLISFRLLFYVIGRAVGEYPRFFLLFSGSVSLTTIAMKQMVLRDSIQEGYTPLNAPSFYESKVMREFSDSEAEPMRLAFMMIAKDGGSMHRKAYLDEAERIMKTIYNLTIIHGSRYIVYRNICEPYCYGKQVFSKFKHYFDSQYDMAVTRKEYFKHFNLSYPYGSVIGYTVPFHSFLFDVKLVNNSQTTTETEPVFNIFDLFNLGGLSKTIPIKADMPIEWQITNIEHVTLIAIFLYGHKNTSSAMEDLSLWELGVYDWSKKYNSGALTEVPFNFTVELLIFGNNILDMEVNSDNRKLAPYFGAGFAFMIALVVVCVYSGAYYNDALDLGKVLIGVGAILCPLLAITCTFGILSLAGTRINSLLFVMPFLIMGVGVDSSFLMTYSWQKLAKQKYTSSERLGMVYQECGPSITISSSTNVLAFAAGYITPTPEVQLFCVGSAVAMGLTYFFQIFLFGATLSIAAKFEEHKIFVVESNRWKNQVNKISRSLFRLHCVIVSKEYIAVFILIATLFYWYYSIDGILSLRTRLDSVKILPKDSALHKPNSYLTNYVWKENLILTVFVNTRFNMMDHHLTKQFWDALKELENLPRCRGPSSSYVWFRDFINKGDYPYNAIISSSRLSGFFRTDEYHFINSVKLSKLSNDTYKNDTSTLTVERFFFTLSYTNVSNWDVRIELMSQWRRIASKYPDLNMTVYEPGGMFVDQMLNLRETTLQTSILTLFSMAVVCAIFIGKMCSVITATVSIASVTIGVVGIMSKLSFELDPVVMIALLMTIGLSVDYIAHVAYHFQNETRYKLKHGMSIRVVMKSMAEKVEHTVLSVAWPMMQAAISTICCVLPLVFVSTYSSSVFFTSVLLVVLFGLIHGLIILPAFLSRLPEWLSGNKCCCRERFHGGISTQYSEEDLQKTPAS